MSSCSSTGGSAADRCVSPSTLFLVPGTPSAGRSTEESGRTSIFTSSRSRIITAATTYPGPRTVLGGFPGGVLCEAFLGMNREKQWRHRGPSPVSLSLGSPAAPHDPATCLSLYWSPADSSHHVPHPPKPNDKRGPKNASAVDSEDKRRKRLMKNRESADRSRARKQAYTNELEKEVALLRKENAWLRSQQEKMWSAVPSVHRRHHMLLPEETKLHRTSSAPL